MKKMSKHAKKIKALKRNIEMMGSMHYTTETIIIKKMQIRFSKVIFNPCTIVHRERPQTRQKKTGNNRKGVLEGKKGL